MKSFLKNRPLFIGYLIFTIGIALAFVSIEQERDDRTASDVESRVNQCLIHKDGRDVLREVIVLSTNSSGTTLDLTLILGFEDLSPETQVFMRNLSDALVSEERDSARQALRDRMLAVIPPVRCTPNGDALIEGE